MDGEVKVTINYDRVADDSKWDGLKGYLTNTDIPNTRRLCCIPQPLACRTGFPYSQIKDRDTSHVSFYMQTHRGSYMHLLCGFERIQGTGSHAESLRDQDERRQGACFG